MDKVSLKILNYLYDNAPQGKSIEMLSFFKSLGISDVELQEILTRLHSTEIDYAGFKILNTSNPEWNYNRLGTKDEKFGEYSLDKVTSFIGKLHPKGHEFINRLLA